MNENRSDSAPPPAFSFVLITANRCPLLLDALATVTSLPTQIPYEVVVVDNGSTDETRARVGALFPDVVLVPLEENRGVAGGRNVGAARASGDYLVFMDDDALLTSPDILEQLTRRFAARPNLAVVAFKIVNDETGTVLGHEFPMRAGPQANQDREQPVGYFIGCGFAARRDVFLREGGFYEAMVYGLEELDLSYRLLDAGFELLYCPAVVVRHRTAPAERRDDRWYYHMMRSRVLLVLRNLPWWAAGPHLLIWTGGLLLHALRHRQGRGFVRGLVDGVRAAPGAFKTRKPIRRQTAQHIRALSGRLYY